MWFIFFSCLCAHVCVFDSPALVDGVPINADFFLFIEQYFVHQFENWFPIYRKKSSIFESISLFIAEIKQFLFPWSKLLPKVRTHPNSYTDWNVELQRHLYRKNSLFLLFFLIQEVVTSGIQNYSFHSKCDTVCVGNGVVFFHLTAFSLPGKSYIMRHLPFKRNTLNYILHEFF